jgi:hypothetical protein
VRSRARGDEGVIAFGEFLPRIKEEIRSRALPERKATP